MKNWRIGVRITAGFGLVVAIAAGLGLFALRQTGQLESSANGVARGALPSMSAVWELYGRTESLGRLIIVHVNSTGKEEIAQVDEQIREARAANGKVLARYEKEQVSADKEKDLLADLTNARTSFWVVGEEVLKLSRADTDDATKKALQMYRSQLLPL